MRFLPVFASLLLCALTLLTSRANADTVFHYTSEAGDYIGQGQERTIRPSDGLNFQVTSSASHVGFYITGSVPSGYQFYNLDFAAPQGVVLAVSDYADATRYPFQEGAHPGLDFSANGSGSNELTGEFQILELTFDAGGNLATFAADFVQHSEGGDPASYGQIRFNSSVPYLHPAGVAQLGNNHYQVFETDGTLVVKVTRRGGGSGPLSVNYATSDGTDLAGRDYTATSGALTWMDGDISDRSFAIPILDSGNPLQGDGTFSIRLSGAGVGAQTQATVTIVNDNSSVTFLHFQSDMGDYIGGGQEETDSIATSSTITASRNYDGGVSFRIEGSNTGDYTDWSLDLAAATGGIFGVGDYENTQRFPFQEAMHPGLDFSGDGRGSNTSTGNFQVLEAVFGNDGTVLKFAANFEQHSEGGSAALYGQIRYNSTVPLPPARPAQVAVAATTAYAYDYSSSSPGVFTISRTGSVAAPLTVTYQMAGSAVNGHDYLMLKGTKKIKAGKSSAQILVYPTRTGATGKVVAKLVIQPQSGQYNVVSSANSAKVKIYRHGN